MKGASTLSFSLRSHNHFGLSGPLELFIVALLFVVLLGWSILKVLHGRIDSDEPYHIHVAWSWTRGLIQYRDVFDNHMPLFHLVFAPLAGLVGERPAIVIWMRFFLLPMYFVSASCVYLLGAKLFSRRVGIWATLLVGFFPAYNSLALQFRTDNLWTPLFLLCVLTLVSGTFNIRRFVTAGVILGLCFAVSLKSVVFLASIAIGFVIAILLTGYRRFDRSLRHWLGDAAAFIGAAAVIPLTIALFFTAKGLWPEFRYQVLDFNFLARLVPISHRLFFILGLTLLLAVVIWSARWIVAFAPNPQAAFGRAFIFLVCAIYLFLIEAFWHLSKTYAPAYPLAAVMASAGLCFLSKKLADRARLRFAIFIPAAVTFVLAMTIVSQRSAWKDKTVGERTLLRDVLALTSPSDYVLDAKGETIFRRRCFRPLLERITRKAIKRGVIHDDAPQRCIDTRTCIVSTRYNRYSSSTRAFIERAYLPVADQLSVAGTIVRSSKENPHRYQFEVVIPANYQIISRRGEISGVLDGASYDGPRFLDAGSHVFEASGLADEFAVLWSNAVDRHYLPAEFQANIDKTDDDS